MPAPRQRPAEGKERDSVVSRSINGDLAIRIGDWKLYRPAKGGKDELYNLAADPSEKRNVAAAHPQDVQRLGARLDAIVGGAPAR